jgi:hypothetical protein
MQKLKISCGKLRIKKSEVQCQQGGTKGKTMHFFQLKWECYKEEEFQLIKVKNFPSGLTLQFKMEEITLSLYIL